jgi:hypothetical protein
MNYRWYSGTSTNAQQFWPVQNTCYESLGITDNFQTWVVLDSYLVLFWKIFFFPLYMFFWYFFMNTIFENRKSKIDYWLLITILNIVYVKSTTNLRPSWRAVTKTFHAYSYHVQAEICLFYEALSNVFTSLPQELGNFLSMVTWSIPIWFLRW